MHPPPPTTTGSDDPRVYLDRLSNTWRYEDSDGEEWEWQPFLQHSRPVDHGETEDEPCTSSSSSSVAQPKGHWVKILDQELLSAQQAAYSIDGVDPSQPSQAILRRGKKRPPPSSSQDRSETAPKKAKPITSLYITGLPLDSTADEIAHVFSRYGVLLEDDNGNARVKMYYDPKTGMFKGEALVVYFKPESVELAINMLDETSLRGAIGQHTGPIMRVRRAEFPSTTTTDQAKEQKRNLSDQDRKKIAKRVAKLENKLSDWRDSPSPTLPSNPGGRTVVLTKMFTLDELDSDPSLLLDLKQDVREECNRIGGVTNVILYDKEPEGIITVKFSTPEQAEECVKMMKGRFFAQRKIDAWIGSGEKFKTTSKSEEENGKKDAFGAWLEDV